jgi:N-methylhydantoinase B
MDVDPITLEVLRNKLDGIANEMQLTLVRSAFSAIVKEGLDASASLFTLQGETLAQALAIPVHLGALTPMVGRLLHDVPLEQWVKATSGSSTTPTSAARICRTSPS